MTPSIAPPRGVSGEICGACAEVVRPGAGGGTDAEADLLLLEGLEGQSGE